MPCAPCALEHAERRRDVGAGEAVRPAPARNNRRDAPGSRVIAAPKLARSSSATAGSACISASRQRCAASLRGNGGKPREGGDLVRRRACPGACGSRTSSMRQSSGKGSRRDDRRRAGRRRRARRRAPAPPPLEEADAEAGARAAVEQQRVACHVERQAVQRAQRRRDRERELRARAETRMGRNGLVRPSRDGRPQAPSTLLHARRGSARRAPRPDRRRSCAPRALIVEPRAQAADRQAEAAEAAAEPAVQIEKSEMQARRRP